MGCSFGCSARRDRSLLRRLWRGRFSRPGTRRQRPGVALERLETRVALAADTFAGNPHDFVVVGDRTFFVAEDRVAGQELWVSDGTATGTRMVLDIHPGKSPSSPMNLTAVGTTLFFIADDGVSGMELWKSDGTAAGTTLVKDILPGTELGFDWQTGKEVMMPRSSFPDSLVAFQGRVYFNASDETHGSELWSSDGTAAGTRLVKDFADWPAPGSPGETASSNATPLLVVGDSLMVTLSRGNPSGLWKTDGTDAGTVFVADVEPDSGRSAMRGFVGESVLFSAFSDGQSEIWRTDGTAAGTSRVHRFNVVGEVWDAATPQGFAAVGSVAYFVMNDIVHGSELWRTDGTDAGTWMVKDINTMTSTVFGSPGETYASGSGPADLTPVAGGLVFSADDGQNGRELWKTDGTTAGTVLLKDFLPGSMKNPWSAYDGKKTVPRSGSPSGFTTLHDAVYLLAGGNQLWKTDGTTAGTTLVKDVDGPANGSTGVGGSGGYGAMAVLNGRLLFSADHAATGVGLFTSDETAAGTVRMRTLAPQVVASAAPAAKTFILGDKLTFTASFTEPVKVTGKPTIALTVGKKVVQAVYDGGSGSETLSFSYVVRAGDADADGIATASTIVGGTITNTLRTPARRALVPQSLPGVVVEAIPPAVTAVVPPANGTYRPGDVIALLLRFSEPVDVVGVPSLTLTIGSVKRQAVFVGKAAGDGLLFEYQVAAGDQRDSNGIGLAGTIVLNGGSIRDAVGNPAITGFRLPALGRVRVDPTPPI